MARRKKQEYNSVNRPPARSPKKQEDEMIALAMDVAERQLREGTASAQVITHFLKLGSTRERLEQEEMARKIELEQAKAEMIQSAKHTEELYANALKAMREYQGAEDGDHYEDKDDYNYDY